MSAADTIAIFLAGAFMAWAVWYLFQPWADKPARRR